jgi:hypothetical protein
MTRLGVPPMPWQRYMLDVALEIDPDTGVFAYREVDLSVMRQQGKTEAVKGLSLWRLGAWPAQGVMYTAQTRNDARDKLLEDFWPTYRDSSYGDRLTVLRGLGSESIAAHHRGGRDSRLRIMANTKKAGHGGTLDLGLIDEAFAHADNTNEQAMSPAMLTRAMAQLWVLSAAGTEEESHYWNDKRRLGRERIERLWRSGLTEWPSICYFEWYPRDGMARNDPATWWDCMPALGYTITEATVKSELEKFASDPGEFDRGMLNRTAKRIPPPDPNVPAAEFGSLVDAESRLGDYFALAVDVSPDRQASSSISAFGARATDETDHGELIDYRPGVKWLIPRLITLRDRYQPVCVVIDDRGAAAALIPELERAGLKRSKDPVKPRRGELMIVNSKAMGMACGQFADATRAGAYRHRGQRQLMIAIGGARTRPLDGAWAWDRRYPECDITPLVSLTLARYGWRERGHLRTVARHGGVW